jgi:hypothetical protein
VRRRLEIWDRGGTLLGLIQVPGKPRVTKTFWNGNLKKIQTNSAGVGFGMGTARGVVYLHWRNSVHDADCWEVRSHGFDDSVNDRYGLMKK